jgi:hypothetical protein
MQEAGQKLTLEAPKPCGSQQTMVGTATRQLGEITRTLDACAGVCQRPQLLLK